MRRYPLILLAFVFITACSSKSDKEYFDLAKKNLDEKNYTEAVKNYEALAEHHSGSDLAPQALFACGKIYQSQLIPGLSREASLHKAIEYYKKVYNDYGDKPDGQKALFMIGFIQANELNQIDSARTTYDLYLQKYPNGELAESAKLEKENLGLTPEEVLKKKLENQPK